MLPESSSMNIRFGDTEVVVEDVNGAVANATEADNAGSGSTRLAVSAKLIK
jgi:hypothetical protein